MKPPIMLMEMKMTVSLVMGVLNRNHLQHHPTQEQNASDETLSAAPPFSFSKACGRWTLMTSHPLSHRFARKNGTSSSPSPLPP